MGEAVQTLRQPIITIPIRDRSIAASTPATYLLPVPCYPFYLEFVKVKGTIAGVLVAGGSFDVQIDAGVVAETFYLAQSISMAQQYFDNLAKPIQVGNFNMVTGQTSNFNTTVPPSTGSVTLVVSPVLPVPSTPYVSVIITNRFAGGAVNFDVDLGVTILDRGLDFAPTFYPGAGSSALVSSSNI